MSASEYVIDGPCRLDAGSSSGVGVTLGSDEKWDLWTRSDTGSAGVMERIAPPSGIDGTYQLDCVRSGGNSKPVWTLSAVNNQFAISVVHPGFATTASTPQRVGSTGTSDWTTAAAPFFVDAGAGWVPTAGTTGGIYTVTTTGRYEIAATVVWDNSVINRGSRIVRVLRNPLGGGTATEVAQLTSKVEAPSAKAIDVSQTVASMLALDAADEISIEVEQGSDSAVTINSVNLAIRHI